MAFTRRPMHPSMTFEQLVAALNENFSDIENAYKTTIYRDDTGLPRILIGYHKDGF